MISSIKFLFENSCTPVTFLNGMSHVLATSPPVDLLFCLRELLPYFMAWKKPGIPKT